MAEIPAAPPRASIVVFTSHQNKSTKKITFFTTQPFSNLCEIKVELCRSKHLGL